MRSYSKHFRLSKFIETGTYLGETTEWMARLNLNVISIELSSELYSSARERLKGYANVELLLGDSAQLLPKLISMLNEPACFWLDAHYSGGGTAKGGIDTPIMQELKAILEHSVRGHIILIDDARYFCGENGYPFLEEVLAMIRHSKSYRAEVSTDIIRITPI